MYEMNLIIEITFVYEDVDSATVLVVQILLRGLMHVRADR